VRIAASRPDSDAFALGWDGASADTHPVKPRGMTWTDSSWLFLVVAVIVLFVRGLG
jgi:hypothetical protein